MLANMLVTTTVDIKYLIQQHQVEVNPVISYYNREDFISKVNNREYEEPWYYIFIRNDGNAPRADLTGFTTISIREAKEELLKYSINKESTELNRLRFYYYSEYTDSMFVIDLDYKANTEDEVYELKSVTVYDECHFTEVYKHYFVIDNKNKFGYLRTFAFDANKFEIIQEIVTEVEETF